MNSVAITMHVNTIAAPRSFCKKMHSVTVIAHAYITGFNVRSQFAISARLRDSTLAQYNNMVTFSTSEGWNRIGPSATHARAPLNSKPKPGIIGKTMSPYEAHSAYLEMPCHW